MSQTAIEIERRNRILVAVAAYAYEIYDDPIMDDAAFDTLCSAINPGIETGNPALDAFFRIHFDSSTGVWIYQHPDLDGVAKLFNRWKNNGKT